jgi:hypothetical protein
MTAGCYTETAKDQEARHGASWKQNRSVSTRLEASDAIPMVLLPGLPPPQHRSNYTRCVEHAFTLLLMMLRGYMPVSHPFSRARLWKYFSSRSPAPQRCFQTPHFLYCWQLYQPLTVYLPARAVKFPQLLICSSLLP